jgi:hypothetical protein
MRKERGKAFTLTSLALLVVLSLAVPGIAMGAGDDCPPPGDGGNDEVYTPPTGDEGGEEQPSDPEEGGTDGDDGGVLGSLGNMSSSQLTFGILAIVGVIVGAVYFYVAMSMDDDIIE